jgi:hypothetical protein
MLDPLHYARSKGPEFLQVTQLTGCKIYSG